MKAKKSARYMMIKKALLNVGCTRDVTIEWEPIRAGCEMEGPYGGWMLDGFPVGYNVGEVLEHIQLCSDEYKD